MSNEPPKKQSVMGVYVILFLLFLFPSQHSNLDRDQVFIHEA
jgi:hypothetical protein